MKIPQILTLIQKETLPIVIFQSQKESPIAKK